MLWNHIFRQEKIAEELKVRPDEVAPKWQPAVLCRYF